MVLNSLSNNRNTIQVIFLIMFVATIFFTYMETITCAEDTMTPIIMGDSETLGTIKFIVLDGRGTVGGGGARVYIIDENTGNVVSSGYTTSNGEVTFNVISGTYNAMIIYLLGNPKTIIAWQYGIVAYGEDISYYDLYIEQAWIKFIISDNNGPVGSGQARVYLYDNETGLSIGSDETSSTGEVMFNVVPGKYDVLIAYLPGCPKAIMEWRHDIVVNDGSDIHYDQHIDQGWIKFIISDNDGSVGLNQARAYLYDNETGLSVGYDDTSQYGEVLFNVVSGRYDVKIINFSAGSDKIIWICDIRIIDSVRCIIDVDVATEEYTINCSLKLKPDAEIDVPYFNYNINGMSVSFIPPNYSPDEYITAYYWDFGDGKTSNAKNAIHTYSMSGNYPVTLIVTSIDGYKASKTQHVSVEGGLITRIIHPSDIPFGAELTVEVSTNLGIDVTVDIDTFHQTAHGVDVVFNIDTALLHKGTHTLTVTAGDDTYGNQVIVYDPPVYQSITKGIDDIGTCSKGELREISGKTGYTLTNHVYTILLGIEIGENVTAGDLLYTLRDKMDYADDKISSELERFKDILITIDSETSIDVDGMDSVINSITNIRNAINEFNDMVSDENIVGTVNEYVMKPAVYMVICADEANSIDARTQDTKSSLDTQYPQDKADRINEVLLIGKEAIANTDGEQVYKLYIGSVMGHEISVKPTLDHFAGKQEESLNPPPDVCVLGYCIPGKYDPRWVYSMTVADAESILTIPAYIGWIPATPEDEVMQPSFGIMFEPVTVTVQAIKMYMKYVDMIEIISPWIIDGGMVVSTDLLAKEVDEEHADVIQAVYDTLQMYGSYSVSTPTFTGSSLYVPEGNIMVATSPDGKIRNFKYVESDSVVSVPKNRNLISVNTGWSQSFSVESQNIWINIDADNFSYNVGDIVNLTVNVSSDTYIEDAMLWVFVPEANITIKDIMDVPVGNIVRRYNFTIYNETWHVPRVYLADFGTILAENYTTLSVGSESSMRGLVMVDSDEFYDPGAVTLNVTVHNTGNTQLNSRLDYFGTHPSMTGHVDIPALDVGEQVTEQLTFELTAPDIYEMYFVLNSSSSVLDYNVARFTVTAIDTLLAFPMTDKPIYDEGEDVNVTVTVKNITLDIVDFPYALSVMTPAGDVVESSLFVPEWNGTYIVKAEPIAEGYCVVEGETLFIVEKQSSLEIETETTSNITVITVRTDVGGAVGGAEVIVNGYALKTDVNGAVEFSSFNVTQLIIRAEKFGFNPDLVSVDLGVSVFNLSLNEGWNLISLPLQPVNTSLFSVFPPDEVNYTSVWTYYGNSWNRSDLESPFPHLNDLHDVEAGRGYWINMDNADVVTIRGSLAGGSVHLTRGWNLVGYNALVPQGVTDAMSSVDGNYTSVWQYEDGDWDRYDLESPFPHLNDLHTLGSGYGYWINVNSTGCEWVI